MANKSFVVQYLIKARDMYSKVTDKATKSTRGMEKSIKEAKEQYKKSSESIKKSNEVIALSSSKSLTLTSGSIKKVSNQALITRNSVDASFSKMASDVHSSSLKIRSSSEIAGASFDKLKSKASKVRNVGLGMSIGVTLPIGLAIKKMVDDASDVTETVQKFDVVFSKNLREANKTAGELGRNYGIAGSAAKKLMGDTGDLLTGFGFSQKDALDVSKRVNELAVDLASFTNFSGGAEGASAALTKALLGERESVKSLGIAILDKDVKLRVSKMIAEGQRFESMRQAKAMATLSIAVEQSKNAIGDFHRSMGSLANQQRITESSVKDLSESFGMLLIPAAKILTKTIRGVADGLNALPKFLKKTLLVIAGLVAVIGPLLVIAGSLVLMWPLLAAGAAGFSVAMAPLIPIAMAIASAALLIIMFWQELSTFFTGFFEGIDRGLGGTMSRLIDNFKQAAAIIVELFGGDSDAVKAFNDFSNVGALIGEIIGGSLSVIINMISGVGEIIGQLMGAIFNFDFSNFDVDAIKAEFMGSRPESVQSSQRVDVGVNVGLDKGLTQTTPTAIIGNTPRRADVGVMSQ